jgi:hypothetical protein
VITKTKNILGKNKLNSREMNFQMEYKGQYLNRIRSFNNYNEKGLLWFSIIPSISLKEE